MNEYERSRRGLDQRRANELLRACREQAKQHLCAAVGRMLDKVDDALFELAEKAENNAVQSQYFDAMREVRIKRSDMERIFQSTLIDGFNTAVAPAPAGSAAGREGDELELDLVGDDEMEENLAVTNMVQKIETGCTQELGMLDRRIGYLLADEALEGHANPVGPRVLCNAFLQACSPVESGLKVKLIILKLYDRYVVSEDVLPLYKTLNRFLVSQDVLPDLRSRVPSKSRTATAGGTAAGADSQAPAGEDEQDQGPDLFAALQQLAPAGGYGAPGGVGGAGGVGGVGGGFGIGGTVPAGFLQGLTLLQQGTGGYAGLDARALGGGSVNVIHDVKAAALAEGVGGLDALIIDVVSMLFDYILDDRDIPDPMKALIGRLQIPMLKIAMQDQAFFNRKSHPARRLLNALAEAAAGWNPDDRDSTLYQTVESIVQRVQTEFDDDVALFEELLEELEAFMAEEAERASEQEAASTGLLRSKEQLHYAKQYVEEEIAHRTRNLSLPAFIRSFMVNYWKNYLLVMLVREGDGSLEWKRALTVTDNLLWSIRPKLASERDRLVRMLPGLLESLREGMELVAMSDDSYQAFLSQLGDLHAQVVQQARADAGAEAGEQALSTADPLAADPLAEDIDDVDEQVDELADAMDAEAHAAAHATLHRLLDEQGLGELDVEEIILDESGDEHEVMEDEFTEMARSLQQGGWVEFVRESGETVRAKLTWISPVTGSYLFTNRKGLKEADMTLQGLAAEFRRGSARPIDAVPLFDRAVSHMLDGLQQAG
ncbi:hypothetical protein TspCOW1_19410 [Thiohalobacter sp. COW1]|nr:hypothetical protein TspCOW1_19410 [Thiohalobacter sp. COW1]